MLLRNKRTGFVYAYTKALASDSEYEIWTEEKAKEEPVESPPKKRVPRPVWAGWLPRLCWCFWHFSRWFLYWGKARLAFLQITR